MSNLSDLLESRLADGSDVYIDSGASPSVYLEELANYIRRNACQPSELSALEARCTAGQRDGGVRDRMRLRSALQR